MKHPSRILGLLFLLSLVVLPHPARSFDGTPAGAATLLAPPAQPLSIVLAPRDCEDDCPAQPISCGETLMAALTTQDFQDDKGRYFDIYRFSGTAGQQITATLFSDDFKPHLELRTPGGEDAAEAEGEDPGTTARIDYTLTSTSNNWRLIAKGDDTGVTGGYSLTLQCGGGTPPPPPPPPPPPAGGSIACGETVMGTIAGVEPQDGQGRFFDIYRFSGTIGEQITASLFSADFEPHLELLSPGGEDVAEAEGANPGTTARIDYTLTSTSNNWRLEVKPDDAGATGTYSLTLQCGAAPPPPPPPSGFFIDPAYPNFQFRVRIGPSGSTSQGRREAGCQAETVCVSGALPGRSELFIRILGPRPNGFLWPTIVRFTPSRVVVDIRQVSTGQVNTYTLEAVPAGVEDLSGFQDRTGFMP